MVLGALLDGLRRVAAIPLPILGLYVVSLAATLPIGVAGGGCAFRWWTELGAEASGFSRTFGPGALGFAALLPNPGDLADRRPPDGALAGFAIACIAAWTFLAGGTIDRLARQQRVGGAAFLDACRAYFWRLARLALLAGAAYWFLLGVLRPWLFGGVPGALTLDGTAERGVFLVRTALHTLFGAALAGAGSVFDYARVRAIVEDRYSMVGALLAAIRFIRRRPAAVAGLWLLNAALAVLVLTAGNLAATGAGAAGPAAWDAFAIGPTLVAARLFTTLVACASQTAYFQSRLAYATYVARCRPRRRESTSGRTA